MRFSDSSNRHKWLQAIVSERFGSGFSINPSVEKGAVLRLDGSEHEVEIRDDYLIFDQDGSDLPCSMWSAESEGWSSLFDDPLPMPGVAAPVARLIDRTEGGYRINYDILGLLYWMLTRREEIGRTDLDIHERLAATSSHAFRHGYLHRPIVDEWLDVLRQVLSRLWPDADLVQHDFAVKVSHDVDIPGRYAARSMSGFIRAVGGDILRHRQFGHALKAPLLYLGSRKKLHSADPANTFDWLMDMSEQRGLRSAFYFICGRTDPLRDADYEIEHPAIRELIRRIHRRGHEIGLHPSFNTYRMPGAIAREAARLRRLCEEEGIRQADWGGRMHYLRWEHPTTMLEWERASLSYDSTLGYADMPGFRCGTCHEYPAFDPVGDTMLKLRIRPLVAMECTIIAERYMGLGHSAAALHEFSKLKEACRKAKGNFTLLWHNSELSTKEDLELYQDLLLS